MSDTTVTLDYFGISFMNIRNLFDNKKIIENLKTFFEKTSYEEVFKTALSEIFEDYQDLNSIGFSELVREFYEHTEKTGRKNLTQMVAYAFNEKKGIPDYIGFSSFRNDIDDEIVIGIKPCFPFKDDFEYYFYRKQLLTKSEYGELFAELFKLFTNEEVEPCSGYVIFSD